MMRRNVAFGLAFFCVALLVAAFSTPAAPPANDQCSGAELINTAVPFPWLSSVTTNMHEATVTGDPQPPTNCYPGAVSKSVWYAFLPPVDGLYTVSVKFTATTVPDTLMGIYTSAAGCSGPFTQVACNDDAGTVQSAVTANFSAGNTYYVVIWHTLTVPLPEGERNVQLKVLPVLPPVNEVCESAEEVPSAGPFPYLTAVANTHLASTNGDPAGAPCTLDPDRTVPQRSVWYRFRPVTGGNYIFAVCTNSTRTTVDDTTLAVYQNSGGCSGTMTQVNCNDSGLCGGSSAGLAMPLLPDMDYYIVVWDVASRTDPSPVADETEVQLLVDQQGPPSIRTVGHTDAAPTTVTLLGEVNTKGVASQVFFELGATTNYGRITLPWSTMRPEFGVRAFSRVADLLSPGTTVHYRAAATNIFGVYYGEDKTVTLPFPPPEITSVTMQANGLQIQFTGSEGYIHEVQVSEDLQNWARLGDATPLEFDQFEYVDAEALTRTKRFYRIKL